jgi:outer membrane usher protein
MVLGAMAQPAHSAEALAAAMPPAGGAASFDDGFFPSNWSPQVDLARFEKPNAVAPGVYRADVMLNGEWRARTDLTFVDTPGIDEAQPCYDISSLESFGVDLVQVSVATRQALPRKVIPTEGKFCGPIGDYVPGATAVFDDSDQTLSLSVPQIYASRNVRGYVDPKYWDGGINAAAINYNANLYHTRGTGGGRTNGYLGLNASANVGSWHGIHLSSVSWAGRRRASYRTAANYLQHDIPAWKAQVEVGDVFTSGQLFDGVGLRGVHVYTDERMFAQSLRGYAPVVRGIAETNARVLIKQRGYTLLETTVAPGPFVIDDLYPTGYGGDLEVEVIEADSRIKRFSVPYAAVPQLLRTGQSRWEVSAGKLRQPYLRAKPSVAQVTHARGISNLVTGYTGITLASGYQAALVGGALNTRAGAISLDVTRSRAQVRGQRVASGSSVRLGYSKNIPESGTNFSLAAYRYSTRGYVSLNDLAYLRDAAAGGLSSSFARTRARSELTASVYQSLGQDNGQIFFTGAQRLYWNHQGKQVDFTAGYSGRWRSLTYSISAQRTRDSLQDRRTSSIGPVNQIPGDSELLDPGMRALQRRDTRVFISLSMPLGVAPHSPTFTAMTNRSQRYGNSSQLMANGSAGEDDSLTYNATLSDDDRGKSIDLSGQYNGGHGNLQAGYGQGRGYRQTNAGISGGLVLHGGGFTWAPPLGETIGLVQARDAAGARVVANQRSVVDRNHYAVVPNLIPYQLNHVALDPKGMSTGTELQEASHNVAPRARSVVRLEYRTVSGRALLIDSVLSNGAPLPFGAEVFDTDGNQVGLTGQGGQVFVRGVDKASEFTVRWGAATENACRIRVQIRPVSAKVKQTGFERYQGTCVLSGPMP